LLHCLPIVVVGLAAILAVRLFVTEDMQQASGSGPSAALPALQSPRILLGYLLLAALMAAMYGALLAQIDAVAHGKPLGPGAAMGFGLRRAPVMLGVWILLGLMVGIGLLLFIVPGVYWWGLYQLAVVPPIVERAGVLESFVASARLVRGHWWSSGSAIFVASLIVMALMFAVIFVVVAVTVSGVGADALTADPLELIEKTGLARRISWAMLLLNMLLAGFLPAVLLSLYYELKQRDANAAAGSGGQRL
ncbi:MAG TPA: hypothetical protein VMH77_08305, partial [Steroidobacteraceae bacterium]|nr:hypothetical protein [Steroidobacteraceae bacterium]